MSKKKKLLSGIVKGAQLSAKGLWKASTYKELRKRKDPYEGLY